VAAPCEEIVKDPNNAFRYTSRGNLVGVVTNGTAVLGLGDIGPLAAKPVMEGKGVLFKKFAGIDVFDIEINEKDPDKLVEIIAALEPTFGGINLEDIKAPGLLLCRTQAARAHEDPGLPRRPARHRHRRGCRHPERPEGGGQGPGRGQAGDLRRGRCRAGLPGLAGQAGHSRENIWVTDLAGVVYEGRTELMDEDKIQFAQPTEQRTLAEVIDGADVFLGLSAGGVLKPDMVAKMAARR
jgi:malate dehydrogenase (oxaloacetate-decarboxylating)(NADP+)